MKVKIVHILQEGTLVNAEIIQRFDLRADEKLISPEGLSLFVGFIFRNNELLFSFPKHFFQFGLYNITTTYSEVEEDIKLVSKLLIKQHQNFKGYNTNSSDTNNIPLKAFYDILNYYRRYGLYHVETRQYTTDYSGRVSWKKTIHSKKHIVSNYNIIYLPLIIEKKEAMFMFVTECMAYAIEKIYSIIPFYFDNKSSINYKYNKNSFEDYKSVIKKLKRCYSTEFKDINRILINSLIIFFTWLSKWDNKTKFVINYFNLIWENMVNNYLSTNFAGINKEENSLLFSKNNCKFSFTSKLELAIGEYHKGMRLIEIDHYFYKDNIAYVFDSKYYNNLNELDYKQVAYCYFVLNNNNNNEINRIYGALILPTCFDDITYVHLDRLRIDNFIIFEHYINTRKAIQFSLDI
ncbi:LlaJI family restriction endonuclease [Serpentinicella alkaliphila]|uniref:LlaJI restriction endonuclease n=1 Tax=Serpentinicella alkaliphila TaxID=1734049 RepID=A0A4R2T4D2_9FIRM|nr:LlaJI family restriction endonuclease [Serpentinicella alkaliphila]QUH26414.1 LlaJI family restriction endonuclease [Serpentinicella alkaliphila]TCP97849.1 LlaJI restriction endonuclease [Serpentinicella alkaliphila]